jgi:predicted amidohydrolase YtcJ
MLNKQSLSICAKFLPFAIVAGALTVHSFSLRSAGVQDAAAAPANSGSPTQPADLVLINGKILSVDSNDSIAHAIAIRSGKIIAVGPTTDIQKHLGTGTRVIDLKGLTATPGLIDTHGHFAEGGVTELYDLELSDVTSIDDVVRRVKDTVAHLKPGEWLLGAGWDEGKLAEQRYIYASDLDQVTPNNPVWLMHTTGHYAAANSYAMKLAHITSETKNPPAGTIDRNAQGLPTGVLKESAMDLIAPLIPPPSPEQERSAILHMIDGLHHEGMTAIKEAGIQQQTWESFRQLLDQGKLTVRVFALWRAGSTMDSAREALAHISALPKPPQSLGDATLLSGGAKIFMDGSGGARTAWVYKEWNKKSTEKDTGNYGYPSVDPEIYRQQVRLFHQAGVHIGTHAIGDRAIDWVVDTYAQALKEKPTRGLRHSIIHANIPSEHALETMLTLQKEYGAGYPELQAPFMWWIGDTYASSFGPERGARLIPLQTYLKKGIQWGGGSDYPVTPFAARYGIWASIARETLKGTYGSHPFGTSESVDVHTALRSYTAWAAHQLFLENKIGSLEVGKEADIAVWDRDMYSIPPNDIKNLKCEMAIFSGKIVYQAAGAPLTIRVP